MNYNEAYWTIQNRQLNLINSLIRLSGNVIETMNENNRYLNNLNNGIFDLIHRSSLFDEQQTRRYLNLAFHEQMSEPLNTNSPTSNNRNAQFNTEINQNIREEPNLNDLQEQISPIETIRYPEARRNLANLYNNIPSPVSNRDRNNLINNSNRLISHQPINLEGINTDALLSPILPSNLTSFIESIIIPNSPPPVNIPTIQQIRNTTTETIYQYLPNPQNTTCAISHMVFEPNDVVLKINYCGHIFIKNQLLEWFTRSSRCPLCRFNILSSTTRNRGNPTRSTVNRNNPNAGTSLSHSRNEQVTNSNQETANENNNLNDETTYFRVNISRNLNRNAENDQNSETDER